MTNIIKLVLTDHWFEEIKSGRKTHEYRKCTDFWEKRIAALNYSLMSCRGMLFAKEPCFVEFQKAYRKNPERMTFRLEYIAFLKSGINTDLACFEPVFDIKLGERCLWCCSLESFLAKYKFLHKSKFQLNDLFEVQNEK